MDIDRIPFGTDFRHHIQDALRDADILLAVVGPTWLGKTAGRAHAHPGRSRSGPGRDRDRAQAGPDRDPGAGRQRADARRRRPAREHPRLRLYQRRADRRRPRLPSAHGAADALDRRHRRHRQGGASKWCWRAAIRMRRRRSGARGGWRRWSARSPSCSAARSSRSISRRSGGAEAGGATAATAAARGDRATAGANPHAAAGSNACSATGGNARPATAGRSTARRWNRKSRAHRASQAAAVPATTYRVLVERLRRRAESAQRPRGQISARRPDPRRCDRHRARRVSCGGRQYAAVVPGDVARPVRLDLDLLHRRRKNRCIAPLSPTVRLLSRRRRPRPAPPPAPPSR